MFGYLSRIFQGETKSDEQTSLFNPFSPSPEITALAAGLSFSLQTTLHPLCILAANSLQQHLQHQQKWSHNFGLLAEAEGMVIGKMFGVLVVRTNNAELGYLAAFSGKLAGSNHHEGFVPPIFDGLREDGFLNAGMEHLALLTDEIKALEHIDQAGKYKTNIQRLKLSRKNYSNSLQNQIFEQYHFLNKAGQYKSLTETFGHTAAKKPPAGAGECAAPKLLQYAFLNQMEPLALAEFWWGLSPKSANWKHGQFYPPCREKCEPILAHMLS